MAVVFASLSETGVLNAAAIPILVLGAIIPSSRTCFVNFCQAILYFFVWCLYNLFWQPLAKIPGPKLYAISPIPYFYHLLRGDWHATLKQLHDRYGPVVRFAPTDVSFITAEAFKAIYGHKTAGSGTRTFEKDELFYKDRRPHATIFNSNNEDHRRMRRLLAHAFSEKALHSQEDIMNHYVNKFIEKLTEQAAQGKAIDMTSWFNFATFDLIGDLAFGEPFGCLDSGGYHPWVRLTFQSTKVTAYRFIAQRLGIGHLLAHLLPKKTSMAYQEARFHVLYPPSQDDKGMAQGEILELSDGLIVAGSETTATLLSGTTYFLLINRAKYDKLVDEIRSELNSEDEITIARVNQLSYTVAVLNEGLRMYPPVPIGLPRKVPMNGEVVQGYWLPEKTGVSVPHWSAYRSDTNFLEPDSFIPERWLGDPRFASDNKAVLQPFSMGPRNCIGKNLAYAESRLLLVRLLWKFDLELMDSSKRWDSQQTYVLWDKSSLDVKLTAVNGNKEMSAC
ncbi:Isotrichodermin C-15 hydroxylase [Fusarium albosuccineum]|uniref:Isotrichodermin C-15 hydroxylase n=1 Tax=Fusarium albosuccineum TaxID=1237068 RepID=A0A8H4LQY8_9HYPO|nr:Isotrichodermin C-15 hydroxylase [Fusarium albosuccineum]